MFEAVLFDMDGLMFDTERLGHEGWKEAERILGIEIPESVLSSLRGTGIDQCREIFNRAIPGNRYDQAHAIRLEYADRVIRRSGVPVKPGLRPLLEWLRIAGIPAVLATSTGREKAMGYLRQTGVDGLFSGAVFGTETARPKPSPDIFLAAAATVGADPAQCLVLEDSANGMRAGKAAGCYVIAVPDLSPAPPQAEGLWDEQAEDLLDVLERLRCRTAHPGALGNRPGT